MKYLILIKKTLNIIQQACRSQLSRWRGQILSTFKNEFFFGAKEFFRMNFDFKNGCKN